MKNKKQILSPYIAVKTQAKNEYITLSNGLKLWKDPTIYSTDSVKNGGLRKSASTDGIVTQVPDGKIEVKVGDQIIFNYLAVSTAIEEGTFVRLDDDCIEAYIPYEMIFCSIQQQSFSDGRADGINYRPNPINGWLFIMPDNTDIKSTLILPDAYKRELSKTGQVMYAGSPWPELDYTDGEYYTDTTEVKAGDKVAYTKEDNVPIQDSLHSLLDPKLIKMKRQDILWNLTKNPIKE